MHTVRLDRDDRPAFVRGLADAYIERNPPSQGMPRVSASCCAPPWPKIGAISLQAGQQNPDTLSPGICR